MSSSLYIDSFDVYPVVITKGDSGTMKKAYGAARSTGNLGKFSALRGDSQIRDEKNKVIANTKLNCDEITVLDTDEILYDSNYYEISFINKTTLKGSNPHLEIDLLLEN